MTPNVACRTDESGWPVGSMLVLRETVPAPMSTFVLSPTHTYAAPGTYTVTVSVVSTGCDGTVPQRTTRTLSWARAG